MATKHPINGGNDVLVSLDGKPQHDEGGGAVRRQEKTGPEWTIDEIVEHLLWIAVWNVLGLLWPARHRADIDDAIHPPKIFGQGEESQQVGSGDEPRGSGCDEDLCRRSEPLFDPAETLKLWVVGGEEEISFDCRCEIDEREQHDSKARA